MAAPISRKQEMYLRAGDRRINVLTGSVRSGKTYVSLLKWALFVGAMPQGSEFLMCGKTVTALKRNCLNLLVQLVGANNFRFSLTAKSGVLFGRQVWLEGANDARSEDKIRGMTLAGAYCDELTLFPQGFYGMLLSRLSARGARLIATTNPDAPTHWVKRDVLENGDIDLATWEFLLTDNPFLDEDYVRNIQREYTGVFYERYILGRWVRAEGVIYPLFANETERFLITDTPGDIVQVNIGVDFGGNKSASVFVATGFTRGFRRVIVLDEEYRPAASEDPEKLAQAFVAFAKRVKAKWPMCLDVYCDSAEQILIRGLAAAAVRAGVAVQVRNAKKSEINERIRLVGGLMGADRFRVGRQCARAIRALQDAVWDPGKLEDERLDDGTTDIDTLDALEYAIEPVARYLQLMGGGQG